MIPAAITLLPRYASPSPSPTPSPSGPGSVPAPALPAPSRWLLHTIDWAVQRPWLALLAVAGLAGYVAAAAMVRGWRHRHHAEGARLVTIAPPPQVDAAGAAALWANLAGILTPSWRRRLLYGRPHVVFEYAWTGRQLLISLWVPGTVPPGAVEAAVRGAWPGAATTTTLATEPIPSDVDIAVGGHLLPTAAEWLPLRTDHNVDPLRALVSAGSQLKPGEHACVQILARPAGPRRAARARKAAARLRDGKTALPTINPALPILWALDLFGPTRRTPARTTTPAARRDPGVERDVRAIVDKTAHPLWETGIRYAVAAQPRGRQQASSRKTRGGTPPEARLRGIADAVASSFAAYTARNTLAHRRRMADPVGVLAARRLGPGFVTSTPELAALAGLPQDLAVPGLDRARAKPMPAPVAVPGGGRGVKVLGDAQVGGHPAGLAVADARYHVHMLGSTGSGKSTLMAEMILGDVRARRGVVVVDPTGDLVVDILDRLPASVADRLVLFDPDQPNPPYLNPLEGNDPDLVVDNVVSIFGKIFAKFWGPRMDDVMRVSCLTLMRHAGVNLQYIPPLLNNDQFRAEMTADLDDPSGLGGFWEWFAAMRPGERAQVVGPVLARLRAFLLRDFVRRTMSAAKSSFDMAKVLDGGILLARLPKGVLGEDTARLLGSLLVAQVWQAATARASIPAERRRDCALYLDECQNFLTLSQSVADILAEARKYRLSLVLAHQDLAQLPRDVAAAISANARNKIYFSCAPEDAHVLARHTLPELDEHDLSHLDAYTAATRLVVAGRETPAFTLKTRPPRDVVGETTALRQACAAAVPPPDVAAIDGLVKATSRKPDGQRPRRQKSPPA